MSEDLDQFIQTLRSEKYYSPHTCSNYRRDLERFRGFLDGRQVGGWRQVDYHHVSAFAAERHR